MAKKVGDYNRQMPANDPTWSEFKLKRKFCSEDLFTLGYCNKVHNVLIIPSEDDIRDWVETNRDWITKSHLSRVIDMPSSYICRWLTRKEFSMGYEKVLKCVDYIRFHNPDASYIYLPRPEYVGDFLKTMVSDGFRFAEPEYIEWKFRVVGGKCTNFYYPEMQNLQFMVIYKDAKKWQNSIFEDYYRYFRLVRDGHEELIFDDF